MQSVAPATTGHLGSDTLRYACDPFRFLDRSVPAVGDVTHAKLPRGDLYVLAHPDLFERVLVTERDSFEKPDIFRVGCHEQSSTDGDVCWNRYDEYLQTFFAPDRVRSYADEMVRTIDRRADTWADGEQISLHEQMRDVALEVLFATLFDRPLDLHGDEELRSAAYSLNEWFRPSSWVLPEWVPTPARRRFKNGRTVLKETARELLADRECEDELGDDLLSAFAKVRQSVDSEAVDEQVLNQVAGFIFAGHETTGLSMAFAWHLLGRHPDVRERFHAELDAVLDGGKPTAGDVGELDVTRNVVREAMRLYAPAHTVFRTTTRAVQARGHRIPPGADVHLSTYLVHRDERFWDDPLAFRPARWTDATPAEKGFAYVPFSAGPRSCIAQRFAQVEATLALAAIGQRFLLEPLSDLEFAPTMTTQPADDLPARVLAR